VVGPCGYRRLDMLNDVYTTQLSTITGEATTVYLKHIYTCKQQL